MTDKQKIYPDLAFVGIQFIEEINDATAFYMESIVLNYLFKTIKQYEPTRVINSMIDIPKIITDTTDMEIMNRTFEYLLFNFKYGNCLARSRFATKEPKQHTHEKLDTYVWQQCQDTFRKRGNEISCEELQEKKQQFASIKVDKKRIERDYRKTNNLNRFVDEIIKLDQTYSKYAMASVKWIFTIKQFLAIKRALLSIDLYNEPFLEVFANHAIHRGEKNVEFLKMPAPSDSSMLFQEINKFLSKPKEKIFEYRNVYIDYIHPRATFLSLMISFSFKFELFVDYEDSMYAKLPVGKKLLNAEKQVMAHLINVKGANHPEYGNARCIDKVNGCQMFVQFFKFQAFTIKDEIYNKKKTEDGEYGARNCTYSNNLKKSCWYSRNRELQ